MHATRTNISSHGSHAWGELVLNVQVPLSHVVALGAGVRVRLAQFVGRERWQDPVKKPTGSRILDRGIFKKGSCLGHEKNELIRQRKDIKQSSAAPHGHLSVPERIPGKTYPRLEIFRRGVADEKRVAEMRVGVSKVSQVGELAMNFRRHRRHLIAEPQIQCKIREPAPVVLQVAAKDGLANITGGKCADNSSLESRRAIRKKTAYISELPNAAWISKRRGLHQHALNRYPKLDSVPASIEERVVVHLEGIPTVQISWQSPDTAGQKRGAADLDLGGIPTCEGTQTSIGCHSINCSCALVVIHGFVVKPESDGIDKGRGEAVGFFGRQELSRAEAAKFDVIHTVWCRVRGSIKQVSSIQTVFFRELMVGPSGNKVFVHHLLTRESEQGRVAVPENGSVGDREEGEIRLGL